MLLRQSQTRCGELVAEILSGAWRETPPPLNVSATQLAFVMPQLLKSGSASLAWWRVRHSNLRDTPAAHELRQSYRLHALGIARQEANIERVFTAFAQHSIACLLFKGHVNAICYHETALRPFGDIDVLVAREKSQAARELLFTLGTAGATVDLHDNCEDQDFRTLYARARVIKVGSRNVHAMGAEDHLRLLAFHLFKHDAWRPLWLCDIAAAVENRPADFDWDLCIGTHRTRSRWVRCAVGLAARLLGARVNDTPASRAAGELPRWLAPAVLRAWQRESINLQRAHPPMTWNLRRPAELLKNARLRFPAPIESTYIFNARFNNLPRFPYQCTRFAQQAWCYLRHSNDADARIQSLSQSQRYF